MACSGLQAGVSWGCGGELWRVVWADAGQLAAEKGYFLALFTAGGQGDAKNRRYFAVYALFLGLMIVVFRFCRIVRIRIMIFVIC